MEVTIFNLLLILVILALICLSIILTAFGFYIIAEKNNPCGFVIFMTIAIFWHILASTY
jgi:hypothetical protein